MHLKQYNLIASHAILVLVTLTFANPSSNLSDIESDYYAEHWGSSRLTCSCFGVHLPYRFLLMSYRPHFSCFRLLEQGLVRYIVTVWQADIALICLPFLWHRLRFLGLCIRNDDCHLWHFLVYQDLVIPSVFVVLRCHVFSSPRPFLLRGAFAILFAGFETKPGKSKEHFIPTSLEKNSRLLQ